MIQGQDDAESQYMNAEDICSHYGDTYAEQFGAVSPPIYQTSLFSRKHGSSKYSYSRINNPTVELVEKKMAALEGAQAALCFSSGMGAISAAIMHCIDAGSHIIAPRNVYLPVRHFLDVYLKRFNVEVTFVGGDDLEEIADAVRGETRLIYLETPVSNIFALQDLGAIVGLVRDINKGRNEEDRIHTIVDNSWSTPLYQKPHRFGIDIVVQSASKYLGGHSDIVAGVASGTVETMEAIRGNERGLYGASLDPFAAWLLVRSLRSLPARMRMHSEHARTVAEFLESHEKVDRVYYPGLDSFDQHELAKRQMTGYSGVMGFIPRGSTEEIGGSMRNFEVFEIGPSWGGYESLMNSPGLGIDETRSQELGIPKGLIRISIGLEDPETIIADLRRMLDQIK